MAAAVVKSRKTLIWVERQNAIVAEVSDSHHALAAGRWT